MVVCICCFKFVVSASGLFPCHHAQLIILRVLVASMRDVQSYRNKEIEFEQSDSLSNDV